MKSRGMKARSPFHVGLGAFVAAPRPIFFSIFFFSLFFFFFFSYPRVCHFRNSSLGERLQDRRKPRPRTARSDSLFFMQFPRFVCPRHRAILSRPSSPPPLPSPPPWPPRRRKTSRRAREFKGTLRFLRPPRADAARMKEQKEKENRCNVNSFHSTLTLIFNTLEASSIREWFLEVRGTGGEPRGLKPRLNST